MLVPSCGGKVGLESTRDGTSGGSAASEAARDGGDGHGGRSEGAGGTVGGGGSAGSKEVPECGDGKRTGREACDGADLGGASCQSVGFTAGVLACGQKCESYDTTGCRKVVSLAAGEWHTCALFEDGRVKCWGGNGSLSGGDWYATGQLGYGDTEDRGDEPGEMGDALPFVDLGTGRRAVALALGNDHTCAVLDDGTVKCWGGNEYGQLGYGDTEQRGDESGEMGDALPAVDLGTGGVATSLAGGSSYTCAILEDGSVKCWGINGSGRLGLGDTERRGDEPGEMGDALPTADLGTGRGAEQLALGTGQSCALLDDGTLKCWGRNDGYGQLGLGDEESRGDEPGEMGDGLPLVDLGTGRTVRSVSAGWFFTCALLDGGSVKCWGDNGDGELGIGDVLWSNRGDEPGEMGDALPAVNLGSGQSAMALAAATAHVCAMLDNGAVKCWGSNGQGRLGLADEEPWNVLGDEPEEMGDALPFVDIGSAGRPIQITAGGGHTCVLLDNAAVKCWGSNAHWATNAHGVLGLGDTDNRGDDPGEMGDALPPLEL